MYVDNRPLEITNISLPNGVVGIPYSQKIETVGGAAPVTVEMNYQQQPWAQFDPQTNLLTGTPDVSGECQLRFKATDANGISIEKWL